MSKMNSSLSNSLPSFSILSVKRLKYSYGSSDAKCDPNRAVVVDPQFEHISSSWGHQKKSSVHSDSFPHMDLFQIYDKQKNAFEHHNLFIVPFVLHMMCWAQVIIGVAYLFVLMTIDFDAQPGHFNKSYFQASVLFSGSLDIIIGIMGILVLYWDTVGGLSLFTIVLYISSLLNVLQLYHHPYNKTILVWLLTFSFLSCIHMYKVGKIKLFFDGLVGFEKKSKKSCFMC